MVNVWNMAKFDGNSIKLEQDEKKKFGKFVKIRLYSIKHQQNDVIFFMKIP